MCCLVTTKGIVFHTGGSSYCVVTQLRGHQWQRAKVWAARDPALTWTMPPLGCKGVRRGRKLNPSSQIWHEVPSFLQGNIKNSSVPQMATLSTSRGVRCVFWRGSFQVPTQVVSRPHLRTGRLLYPLAIRALTPKLLWFEANNKALTNETNTQKFRFLTTTKHQRAVLSKLKDFEVQKHTRGTPTISRDVQITS